MSDDLVKRLRAVDISWSQVGEDCAAAADEIERLRADNVRFRLALEKIIREDQWTTKHPDGVIQRGQSIFDGYCGGIARAALEGEGTDNAREEQNKINCICYRPTKGQTNE